jgi:YHS domain-containing protein
MGGFLLDFLEFVVLALFLRAMGRSLGALFRPPGVRTPAAGGTQRASRPAEPHRGEMVRDPVCGMFVSTELSQQLRHGKDMLHFCSRECLEKCEKDIENVAS